METQEILTADGVEALFVECLGSGGGVGTVDIDCIVFTARLDVDKIKAHRAAIRVMLLELPDQFRASVGGGWSFLNACDDRHGNQWTGMHQTMAKLFALGEAAGLSQPLMPRDMWPVLPGGMPYIVILDTAPAFFED